MIRCFPAFSPLAELFLSPSDFISMSVRTLSSCTHILCVDIILLRNLRKMCFLYYQVECAAGVNADQSNHQEIPVASPLDHIL